MEPHHCTNISPIIDVICHLSGICFFFIHIYLTDAKHTNLTNGNTFKQYVAKWQMGKQYFIAHLLPPTATTQGNKAHSARCQDSRWIDNFPGALCQGGLVSDGRDGIALCCRPIFPLDFCQGSLLSHANISVLLLRCFNELEVHPLSMMYSLLFTDHWVQAVQKRMLFGDAFLCRV